MELPIHSSVFCRQLFCHGGGGAPARALRRGFTLVELLVVVVIIVVLVGMLMPTLVRTKGYVRMVKCRNNLAVVLRGHAMYGSEFNDFKPPLPFPYFEPPPAPALRWDPTFVTMMMRESVPWGTPLQAIGHGLLIKKNLVPHGALLCPSFEMPYDNICDTRDWADETARAGSSYWYFWLMPSDRQGWKDSSALLGELKRGMTYLDAADRHAGALVADINWQFSTPIIDAGMPTTRIFSHPEFHTCNIGFVDGSVRGFSNTSVVFHDPGGAEEELRMWEDASAQQ